MSESLCVLPSEGRPAQVVARLLAGLLEQGTVGAVLVPARQRHGGVVMPTLIADPERLDTIDPFAPVAWSSAAPLVSALTAGERSGPVAVVLRDCELRAVVERAKLAQGSLDELFVIGLDCLGRYDNPTFLELARRHEAPTHVFLRHALDAGPDEPLDGLELAAACRVCETPVTARADLRLCLLGSDPFEELRIEGVTEAGCAALDALGFTRTEAPSHIREAALAALVARRTAALNKALAELEARAGSLDGLLELCAACTSCYNCRVACPVCYCRQCVFVTDSFRQDGGRLMQRARTKGPLALPEGVLFYQLTRMAHIGSLCVGCGQCESACPNGIELGLLFRLVARGVQARFDYVPGADPDEPQPLATYREGEFEDVTGPRS